MFQEWEARAAELVSGMSREEKIGQLNQITAVGYRHRLDELKARVRRGEIGSILFAASATAGNNDDNAIDTELYAELQRIAVEESPHHIPLLYGRDVIHGHRTVYPIPLASAAAFRPELVRTCYRDIACEAAADGVHWTFSPMLDLCHDPRWGRIVEGPGEDPFVGAVMAKACVEGFQGNALDDGKSLVACAKHYIGYGASEGGRDYHRTEISDVTLQNQYLPAFRAAVKAGVGTVMSSFNDINGTPTTGSRKYLTEILRDQLGFEGFVVSDWCAVKQLQKQGFADSPMACAQKALNAGLDMDMVDNVYSDFLGACLDDGSVEEETLDVAVKRVLCVKMAMGLFERPYRPTFAYDRAAHLAHARALAVESMVLLKNDGMLPLKKTDCVALAGPFAEERRSLLGSWTLDGRAEETPNLREALADVLGDRLMYQTPSGAFDNTNLLFPRADTLVLALGESCFTTGEARSVSDVSLSEAQRALVSKARATGKKVVGVLFCGRPMALEGVADELDALLVAWHCGSQTAPAVCDLLFGDENPSGKSPVTFLRRTGHIPMYYNVTSSGRAVDGYYGENPFASYLDSVASPLYPFGFGLSYTTFSYGDVTVDAPKLPLSAVRNGASFTVRVAVQNSGERDGKETVQLYIRDKAASVMRPIRELKGFEKVPLAAGETATVTFSLGAEQLGFYDEKGNFLVEPGEFEVYVGADCLTQNGITVTVV